MKAELLLGEQGKGNLRKRVVHRQIASRFLSPQIKSLKLMRLKVGNSAGSKFSFVSKFLIKT
jgi:hypothetical protein